MTTTPDYPRPTSEMVAEARERACQASEELDVPIDRICVVGTPAGVLDVIVLVLDEEGDQDDEARSE